MIWTGTEMIIWGGYDQAQVFKRAALTTPARHVAALSLRRLGHSLEPRFHHVCVWTDPR